MNYFVKVVELNIWISHLDYLEKKKKLSRSCHDLLRKWLWAVKLNIISAARTHVREASAHRFRWFFYFSQTGGGGHCRPKKLSVTNLFMFLGRILRIFGKKLQDNFQKDFTPNRQNRPNLWHPETHDQPQSHFSHFFVPPHPSWRIVHSCRIRSSLSGVWRTCWEGGLSKWSLWSAKPVTQRL